MSHKVRVTEDVSGVQGHPFQCTSSPPTTSNVLTEVFEFEANYFERNQERMRYPKFRKQCFFHRFRGDRSWQKPLSVDANNRAGSGRYAERTPSSPLCRKPWVALCGLWLYT